ncbi:hypothetical protein BDN67DRAFT_975948 [Paxillus ammoniavirescens]|nr:hypothetical protein BDN67DRAFT_975948 [Paxillus ammoniavirescens]
MLPPFLVFALLVPLAEAQAASTNATCECPAPNPTSSNYRSVWSILGTCALTLLICIWNAAYPNIIHEKSWYKVVLYRGALGLSALVTPEITSMRAHSEWQRWTRAHGFFALMGGFILQDGREKELLSTRGALERLRDGKIVNPKITKKEIRDRSKSDGLGNALLVLQLSWFILQVIARAANNLAITLVEIDTLALATLSLPLFCFWWSKPMAVECPHIFYKQTSSRADDETENPSFEQDHVFSVSRDIGDWFGEIMAGGAEDTDQNSFLMLLIVWAIFGGLHLIAWDFQFPSQVEKIMWRVASLALIVAPCIYFLGMILAKLDWLDAMMDGLPDAVVTILMFAPLLLGVLARFVLLALVFASLRDLPPTAHDTVPWTVYVPHL